MRLDQRDQLDPGHQSLHLSQKHIAPSGFAIALKSGGPIGCRCKGDLLHVAIIGTTVPHNKTGNYEERHLISASLDHQARKTSKAVSLKTSYCRTNSR